MSIQNVKLFMECARTDNDLREKLKFSSKPEDVVRIGREAGYEFTEQEFPSSPDVLDDEEDMEREDMMWSKVVKYDQ